MKIIIALCILGCTYMVCAKPQKQYTDRYDNIDLDEVVSNRRLLVPYLKCVLDQGKCSPEGKELKCKYFAKFTPNFFKGRNEQI